MMNNENYDEDDDEELGIECQDSTFPLRTERGKKNKKPESCAMRRLANAY